MVRISRYLKSSKLNLLSSDTLRNSQEIAELLGTKTESHVRKFFSKYRKKRDLDSVIQQSLTSQNSNDGGNQVESNEIVEVHFIRKILGFNLINILSHRSILMMTSDKPRTLR